MIKTELKDVHEYCEEFPVFLKTETTENHGKRLCVIAYNEGGYNSVAIDAEELFFALCEYYPSGAPSDLEDK